MSLGPPSAYCEKTQSATVMIARLTIGTDTGSKVSVLPYERETWLWRRRIT
jgi:hypothetical protein